MRVQFNKRIHYTGRRIHGGAAKSIYKKVTNINKLADDFSRIYTAPKKGQQKKFVLKL